MARYNFRNMKIWQERIDFVQDNYAITKPFFDSEKFNLISKLNQCTVSIPSTIAEGPAKLIDKYFKTFLETSLGSAFECKTQVTITFKA